MHITVLRPDRPPLHPPLLRQHRLLRPDDRGHLYQFSVLKRSGSDGNPLVWLNVLATGVTLVRTIG